MKTLVWNCRGLARPKAIRSIRANIRKYNPDIIFLLETMVPDIHTHSIVTSLGFHNFVNYPPLGKNGGLLLIWRPGIDIEPVHVNTNAISILVYSDSFHYPWLATYVYAPAQWDFNDLVNQSEKFGGCPVNSSSMGGLKTMMNKHGLVDMGYSGSNFTWTNNRQGKALIRERLDRGIANTKWRLLFPDATIQHLVSRALDHHPLLLNTVRAQKRALSFKFKEFWTKEPIIGTIIQEAWGKQVRGNPSFILCSKIKTTKVALKLWNKVHFGRIQENIKQLESEITHLQSSQPNPRSLQKENQLNIQLQDQLRHKETLWRQKSRINWLTTSDLNTKFYHLSTTIRRRSNGIDSIKIGPGKWLSNESARRSGDL
ncbi:hypothetical protein I3843_08G108700 [Carya illinoinensis]|nr:hypothetical protein I3843_08G108700 [Carya illinoinensis]